MVIELLADNGKWKKGQILADVFRNDGQALIEAGKAKEVKGPPALAKVAKAAEQQPKEEPKGDAKEK